MPDKTATQVAFTPYEISLCLHDVARTRMWKEAIEDAVSPGDVVVDAGSGTGILGVFAAMAGAKRVYCIELHPRFVTLIEHLAERNGVSDVITVIHGDATVVDIPEPVDVLICELLCTGQFFEPEVQVVNHLRQFLRPDAHIIPRQIRSYVRLLDAQERLYGVKIDCDSRSVVLDSDEPVTTRALYDTIDLTRPAPLLVDTTVALRARVSRRADAVLIEGEAELVEGLVTHTTRFLYNPRGHLPPAAPHAGRGASLSPRHPLPLRRGHPGRPLRRPRGGGSVVAAHRGAAERGPRAVPGRPRVHVGGEVVVSARAIPAALGDVAAVGVDIHGAPALLVGVGVEDRVAVPVAVGAAHLGALDIQRAAIAALVAGEGGVEEGHLGQRLDEGGEGGDAAPVPAGEVVADDGSAPRAARR